MVIDSNSSRKLRTAAVIAACFVIAGGCSSDASVTEEALGSASQALTTTYNVTLRDGLDGYSGTTDCYISQNSASSNYGDSTTLYVDGDDPGGSGRDLTTLIRWNVSSIPANATVTAASITIRVTNKSSNSYPIYALNRSFSESSATWNLASTGTSWATSGAMGVADRDSTAMGSLAGSSTGTLTATLNATGIAEVQNWINDPAQNYGIAIASASNTDGLDFRSSEYGTASYRPALNVTYTVTTPNGTGGAPSTGGATATGGAATGGAPTTGGAGTGGSATGGGTGTTVVVMAAGDIQSGTWSTTATFEKTAQVVEANDPDFVFGEGDMSNASGTASDYAQYDKAWGRFKAKTYAVSGNHDNDSSAFYDYFNGAGVNDGIPAPGRHTGPRGKGYFSVNVGSWLLIGLDPYSQGGTFRAGDAQMVWLDSVLAAKPVGVPVVVIHHAPRYTKGSGHGDNGANVSVAWDVLLKYKPDVRLFLCGHQNGIYERWVAMNNSKAAMADGIVSFTVATGGMSPYNAGAPDALMPVTAKIYGALKLTLRPNGYDYDFKPIPGSTFTDKGSVNF